VRRRIIFRPRDNLLLEKGCHLEGSLVVNFLVVGGAAWLEQQRFPATRRYKVGWGEYAVPGAMAATAAMIRQIAMVSTSEGGRNGHSVSVEFSQETDSNSIL
jgi:hypothetical protein